MVNECVDDLNQMMMDWEEMLSDDKMSVSVKAIPAGTHNVAIVSIKRITSKRGIEGVQIRVVKYNTQKHILSLVHNFWFSELAKENIANLFSAVEEKWSGNFCFAEFFYLVGKRVKVNVSRNYQRYLVIDKWESINNGRLAGEEIEIRQSRLEVK